MEPIRDANGKTPGDLWREAEQAKKARLKAEQQARVDAYEAKKAARLEAARQEAEAKRQAQIDRQKAAAAEAERRAKNLARGQWLRNGGDPDAFELSWPGVWRKMQEDMLLNGSAQGFGGGRRLTRF